jgi:hypothetical protein
LEFVAEGRLRCDGVERGHVHFVFPFFCGEADVALDNEVRRWWEDVFCHNENAGNQPGGNMENDDSEKNCAQHGQAPFLGCGAFREK